MSVSVMFGWLIVVKVMHKHEIITQLRPTDKPTFQKKVFPFLCVDFLKRGGKSARISMHKKEPAF